MSRHSAAVQDDVALADAVPSVTEGGARGAEPADSTSQQRCTARLQSRWAGALFIAVYAAALLPIIFSANYIPDELWFMNEAQQLKGRLAEVGFWRFVTTQTNHLGYGPIYWVVQTILASVFVNSLVASRLVGWLAFITMPACLVLSYPRKMTLSKWLALFLWVTFPVAWWTGKLTGPELPSMAAGAVGLALLTYPSVSVQLLGWAALGTAVGIKATAAPLVVFAAVSQLRTTLSWLRSVAIGGFGLALGFAAAGPLAVINPQAYLLYLSQARGGGPPVLDWPLVISRLDAYSWTWDALPNGGAMNWGLSLMPLSIFGCIMVRTWARQRLALFAAASVSFGLCLTAAVFYGWYWFGTLLIFPFAWSMQDTWPKAAQIAAALVVALNLITNGPSIVERYAHKLEHAKIIAQKAALQQCMERVASGARGVDTVLDYSELYLAMDFSFLADPAVAKPQNIVQPVFMAFWMLGQPAPEVGDNALLVVGDRLKRVHAPTDSARKVAQRFAGDREVQVSGLCEGLEFFKLSRPHAT